MKFSRSEYEVTKADSDDFDNKLNRFLEQTRTHKSVMLTLITSFGIKNNKYSGTIQRVVTLSDLFTPSVRF